MRHPKRSAGPIDGLRGEKGGISVEASLAMPLFLLLVLFLVCVVKLSAVQMALQSAVSQTVRQAAATMYAAYLAADAADSDNEAVNMPMADWPDAAAEIAGWLPEPAGSVISAAMKGDWGPARDLAATELGREAIEPLIRRFADAAELEPERVRLSRLSLPDLNDRRDAYLRLEVSYEFPIKVPFLNRPIVLKEAAAERVWVSDPQPAAYGGGQEDGQSAPLQIVSIEPNPLRPGRKARVVARTEPGGQVSLEVNYKSGRSKAKNLGDAAANADGLVEWTWHVSGNTTPGVWELTVKNAAGASVSMHFVVAKSGTAPDNG